MYTYCPQNDHNRENNIGTNSPIKKRNEGWSGQTSTIVHCEMRDINCLDVRKSDEVRVLSRLFQYFEG